MTHGLDIKPHVRDCVWPKFWAEFDGHSPACEMRHRAQFLALVRNVKATTTPGRDQRPGVTTHEGES